MDNPETTATIDTRHRRKTNETKTKTHHRKQRSNTNLTTKLVVNPGSRGKANIFCFFTHIYHAIHSEVQ